VAACFNIVTRTSARHKVACVAAVSEESNRPSYEDAGILMA